MRNTECFAITQLTCERDEKGPVGDSCREVSSAQAQDDLRCLSTHMKGGRSLVGSNKGMARQGLYYARILPADRWSSQGLEPERLAKRHLQYVGER